jgi:DNA-binding NarL/FixJ family response regulator
MTKQAKPAVEAAAVSRDFRLRVGVLAGDPLRLLGLQTIFAQHPVIAIVPVAEDEIAAAKVDVMLIAAQTSGQVFEATGTVRARLPGVRLIVMATPEAPEFMARILRVGAHGYLPYSAALRQMEDAIAHVYEGEHWLPQHTEAAEPLTLTGRERQVLELLSAGNSNREIGKHLQIEERTVKSHVARLLKKMGVKNRTALTMQAIARQVLDADA